MCSISDMPTYLFQRNKRLWTRVYNNQLPVFHRGKLTHQNPQQIATLGGSGERRELRYDQLFILILTSPFPPTAINLDYIAIVLSPVIKTLQVMTCGAICVMSVCSRAGIIVAHAALPSITVGFVTGDLRGVHAPWLRTPHIRRGNVHRYKGWWHPG